MRGIPATCFNIPARARNDWTTRPGNILALADDLELFLLQAVHVILERKLEGDTNRPLLWA